MIDDAECAAGSIPRVAPLYRLQWEPAQDAWVLLFPEGMVKLNLSAGEILKRCDGTRSLDTLIGEIDAAFDSDVGAEVLTFLRFATERRWVEWSNALSVS